MLYRLFLALVLVGVLAVPASAQPAIGQLNVDRTTFSNWHEMAKRCDLILLAWSGVAHDTYPTGKTVRGGKLVNYVQTVQASRVLKGTSGRLVKLLSTGVEPLPDADSPLNLIYPGPLGEGLYVLFLKPVKGTDLHTIAGLWQGVYPVYDGRTVALQGVGFRELHNLPLKELEEKVRAISR